MGWPSWELGIENEKDKIEKNVRGTTRGANTRTSIRKPIEREKQKKSF